MDAGKASVRVIYTKVSEIRLGRSQMDSFLVWRQYFGNTLIWRQYFKMHGFVYFIFYYLCYHRLPDNMVNISF